MTIDQERAGTMSPPSAVGDGRRVEQCRLLGGRRAAATWISDRLGGCGGAVGEDPPVGDLHWALVDGDRSVEDGLVVRAPGCGRRELDLVDACSRRRGAAEG